MYPIRKNTNQQEPGISKKSTLAATDANLHHLAFDNSFQANIISLVSSGKIIMTNRAACNLLGYSKKELLTQSRATIFDINESSFKKMLKQRKGERQSKALVTAIKKSGKPIPCEITSAFFIGEHGIEKAITTITDMSQSILKQKKVDTEKEKIVAGNIALAKSKQKVIDIRKEKIVADNIVIAKTKQKVIDTGKEKMVADNIVLAKSKQKEIDTQKEKIVANNIILAQTKSDSRQAENNKQIKIIAKNSYDVMWDWDIATGEIYVSENIDELFGYKVQNNTAKFTDFGLCLLPEEKDIIEEKLLKTLSSGNESWKDSFMIKRYDGSVAFTTCRASIIRDEKGKAIRLIGAIQDVSRLQELEKKLEEQIIIKKQHSELFQLAAKLSYDGIWEWNILTNDFFCEGFEELFGYDTKKNKGNMSDWSKHLHPDDKQAVEKGLQDALASSASRWDHAYRFIRADGSIAKVFGRASIIRHADGKAYRMIGAIHDLSRQKELEEKLDQEIATRGSLVTEYKKSFKLIFNSSSDVLFDSDLIADKVIISDAYEKEFGYKITGNMTPAKDWLSHIHPDDKEEVSQDYHKMLASKNTEWKYTYRFLKADNSVANVISNLIILRNADGKAFRLIGSVHDISKQKVLEERLELEIKLKEKQMAEAREEAKETVRSEIGKELHDNVNQLLGVSRMYLDMAKQGGENSETYLSRSTQYTLTAIDEIRKLTKGLTTDIIKDLGLCEAIDNIAQEMMDANPIKISSELKSFIEESVSDKFKLNAFRIVQEQLNNIIKHAQATDVIISLCQNKQSIILNISDNGVGFDTGKKRKGIGVDNMKSRASSYNGTVDFVSQPGQGCVLTVTFPVALNFIPAT